MITEDIREELFKLQDLKYRDFQGGLIPGTELDDWTHNKAIQKSIESNRITDEQKQYLKSLKNPRRQIH